MDLNAARTSMLESLRRRLADIALMFAQAAAEAGFKPEDEYCRRATLSKQRELERAAVDYVQLLQMTKDGADTAAPCQGAQEVWMLNVGPSPIRVIRAIRNHTLGVYGLKEAKGIVDAVREGYRARMVVDFGLVVGVDAENKATEYAQALRKVLEEAGAMVEVR